MAGMTTSPFSFTTAPIGTGLAMVGYVCCCCVICCPPVFEPCSDTGVPFLPKAFLCREAGKNGFNDGDADVALSQLYTRVPATTMRPTGGVIVAATLAFGAVHGTQAFAPPRCASSWRTAAAAAGTAHTSSRKEQQHTCSAIDSRCLRRAMTLAATAAQSDEPAADAASAAALSSAEQLELEEGQRQSRRAGVRRCLARGAASLATFTFGATAVSGLSAELQHKLGGAVSVPAAMQSAQASVFKPFGKRSVEEKLGNLPAFMVTNAKGSPYLTPNVEGGHQVGRRRGGGYIGLGAAVLCRAKLRDGARVAHTKVRLLVGMRCHVRVGGGGVRLCRDRVVPGAIPRAGLRPLLIHCHVCSCAMGESRHLVHEDVCLLHVPGIPALCTW